MAQPILGRGLAYSTPPSAALESTEFAIAVDVASLVHGYQGPRGKCVFLYTDRQQAEEAVLSEGRPSAQLIEVKDAADAVVTLTMLTSQGLTHVAFDVRDVTEFSAYPIQEVIRDVEQG